MPAFVNSSVGSLPGTSELEGTTAWPRSRKKSRNAARSCALVMNLAGGERGLLVVVMVGFVFAGAEGGPDLFRRKPAIL